MHRYSLVSLFILTMIYSVASASNPPEIEGREVHFQGRDIQLAGLWFVPKGDGPHPAAVIIRGSGESTRNNYWARSIIDVMLSAGFAVLLPDKRGSGESEGDWRSADFDTLAGDTLSAVRFIRARPDTHDDVVGVVGLSQGGKIAPLAAAQSSDVAFVVNFVGSATSLVEQISWEMYHTFREAGLAGQALQEALALQVTAENYLLGNVDWAAYQARLDAVRNSEWSGAAEGFPVTPDAWQWDFFRRIAGFDPLPGWRRVNVPVLVFYGEADRNASTVRSAYRLTRTFLDENHPDWTIRIIPDAGHGLWQPETEHTHHPRLHEDVVSELIAWLRRVRR